MTHILRYMNLPKELTTVTYLSKSIALVMFIALPIIAFMYGRRYEQTISLNNTIDTNIVQHIKPTLSKPKDIVDNLNKTFSFEKGVVRLDRMGSGRVAGTFWEKDISRVDAIQNELPENELVLTLYESNANNIFYLGGERDTYYELFPGFHRTLTITNSITDYSKKISTNSATACINESTTVSSLSAIKQTCITTVTNPEDTTQMSKSTVKNCYLPLSNNSYFAYLQEGNIIDGEYDLCAELENMGVQNWSI